ncbi:MAG: 16S rRNA processing protein RimM [Solirubrobacterales bacterium]|nr:16S rRNA processing protein RimM [Solirubrobacterales bacterium]
MAEPDRWLRAGIVGRPHGLDGSFHVALPVPALLEAGMAVRVGERTLRVERLAGHARGPIMRLQRCAERADAEALRGQEIFVQRESAPELEEDEWWAEDLEGCAVRDGDEEVGVVCKLLELPSCEVLEVQRAAGGRALLVPLISDAVRDVDLARGVIDIDLRFLGER